ncbi:pumilio homolog 3-like isoform X2 [Actinia tenebrosa]|nr:pumilio homolog 3-like isoform X2 [Actinia tenebrosa]
MQCCVKYGNNEQRKALFMQFKDDFEAMIKSKYSKFFVKKMLKYGTKEQRSVILKCFYGKVRKLIKHKEASEILETIYTDYAVAAQKSSLIQEFYGPEFALFKTMDNRKLEQIIKDEPGKKDIILKNLKDSLNPLVDKSVITHNIIHRVLLEYLMLSDDKAQSEMIESIREYVVLILHTHDGARVAMQCLWNGTAKDRKIILKTFKTYIAKICKEEYGHLVLLSLFDVVDDTVLVKKIIFPEMVASLKELAMDTYGRKVLLYLLMPRAPTHFHPDVVKLLQAGDDNLHSKKDIVQRRKELVDGISPGLLELIWDHGEELMFDKGGCQLVLAIMHKCSGDLVPAMEAIAKAASKPVETSTDEEDHLVKSASGHFSLKKLILQDKDHMDINNEGQTFFSQHLLETVEPESLFDWCKINRGAFVVTSLLESPVPGVANRVKTILKPRLKKLEKYKSKGVEIVLKILHK